MKLLIIDNANESVSIQGEKIRTSHHSIPLKLVEMVVVHEQVEIGGKSIIAITNKDIPILFLGKDSKKMALTLPIVAKNGDMKMKQYHALENRLEIGKFLIGEKITTHQASLTLLGKTMTLDAELMSVAKAMSIDELMGVEGAFARRYFGVYFSLFEPTITKGHRSKNPPLDPVNAMMSYVYMLFYHIITARLTMQGFDASIGYLHTPFRSHFALSSDIMETIRGAINTFVAKLFMEGQLNSSDFTSKGGVYLKYESRRKLWILLSPFIEEQNKTIRQHITTIKMMIGSDTILS